MNAGRLFDNKPNKTKGWLLRFMIMFLASVFTLSIDILGCERHKPLEIGEKVLHCLAP